MIRQLDVLVVEDDANAREIAELLLVDLGHRVMTCTNGLEAVALCLDGAHGFDVVLMDVQMPHLDGIEAVRRLRAAPATRELPIICVSARSSAATREEGLRAGCDRYVVKPIPQEDLFEEVTLALRARGTLGADETFA